MKKFLYLSALVLLLFPIVSPASELPDLGNYSLTVLPPAKAAEIGKQFMLALSKEVTILSDNIVTDYIHSLGYRLVNHTDNRTTHFHFFVVNDSDINAFSGPGGYIGVNTGLILTTSSESELAAVLAHEISHENQLHIARSIAYAKETNLPAIAAMLAAIAVGAVSRNADLATGAITGIMGGEVQSMISFTRENEEEADRVGIDTLYKSGFDPAAMPVFFERMQRASIDYDEQIPRYLQTHPVTTERIADAENRVKQFPKQKAISSLEYFLIRARIYVLTNSKNANISDYFSAKLTKHNYQNRAATEYGYALGLLKENKANKARAIFQELIRQNPYQPIYQIAQAQTELKLKNNKQAILILKNGYELNPDYQPLVMEYIKTLIATNDAKEARKVINRQILYHPNEIALYLLSAKVYAMEKSYAEAYIARAKALELVGNKDLAIIQLQQAEKQPRLTARQKLIIKAKLSELKKKGSRIR